MSISSLLDVLRTGLKVPTERGRVVSASGSNALVRTQSGTKSVQLSGAFSVKSGDYVTVQGNAIVAKRKAPPRSATFQV